MFILWSLTVLCLFCFSNYSNISAGNFALSILVWRTERPVVLVVPTNCPNDCIAYSSSGKNSPQTPLLDEGYSWVLDQFYLADVGVRFTIDLTGRRIKLTEMTVRSTMQIYTYKTIVYVSLGEVSTELFGFLEADTWFCTSRGSAEEKKNWRQRRGLFELFGDDCLYWICMLGKCLTKCLCLRELINWKKYIWQRQLNTYRRTSLHCTFLKKYRIVVSQSPVSGIQIQCLNGSSGWLGRR